jgi:hypothetical protein
MTQHATLARHPPLPAVPPRPHSSMLTAPPALWAQLDPAQQRQIAALIAELIRRMSTPLLPREEVSDDHG